MIWSELRASAWKYGCIAFATLAVVAVLTVLWFRADAIRAGAERADAVQERDSARAEVVSLKGVLDTERRKAEALTAIAEQYEQDKATNDRKQSDLVASLRAGNERLHQRWQAAIATGDLPRTVASAAESDAAARDREESAARAVRAAADADAQIRGLQEVIRADRK